MRFSRLHLYFLLAVFCVFLVGCQLFPPSDNFGYVQQKWSKNLRQLGIVPVFPPREDFFVGDIYASKYNPESTEIVNLIDANWGDLNEDERSKRRHIGMTSRAFRLNIGDEISNEYRESALVAPQTSNDFNMIPINPAVVVLEK